MGPHLIMISGFQHHVFPQMLMVSVGAQFKTEFQSDLQQRQGGPGWMGLECSVV
jgi:hypothetical protein